VLGWRSDQLTVYRRPLQILSLGPSATITLLEDEDDVIDKDTRLKLMQYGSGNEVRLSHLCECSSSYICHNDGSSSINSGKRARSHTIFFVHAVLNGDDMHR
jgi:hypothetical protein